MVKKEKEEEKIEEIKAPIPAISPLFSNVVSIMPHTDMVMIDFGFVGPSYCKPYDFEDNHISRICLDWEAVDNLMSQLNIAITEHKKISIKKKGARSKRG